MKGIETPNPVLNRDDLPCSLRRNDKLAVEIQDIQDTDTRNVPDSLDVFPVTDAASNSRLPLYENFVRRGEGASLLSRKFLNFQH